MSVSSSKRTRSLVYCALFSVIIAVCAWICIPSSLPFTLQTFGIYCTCLVLGKRKAFLSILVYIMLGAVGAPVFAGFKGGLSVLLGQTGGYIWGFILIPLSLFILSKSWQGVMGLILGTLLCYGAGTLQYCLISFGKIDSTSITTAAMLCVLPYIIPDTLKLILAFAATKQLSKHIKLTQENYK